MMSDTSDSGRTDEPAEGYPHGVPAEDEPERFVDGKAADTDRGDAAEPPPADFDPAEHPSNPDLVDDERTDGD